MVSLNFKKYYKHILTILLLIILFVGLSVYFYFNYPFNNQDLTQKDFIIEWGESFSSVSNRLEADSLVKSSNGLKVLARITGETMDIKAGKYTLPKTGSLSYVLNMITEGRQSFIKVTIPEGLTIQRIATLLEDTLKIDPVEFKRLTHDSSYIKTLGLGNGASSISLEGYLFPDTYNFPYGLNEKQIIRQLVSAFKSQVSDYMVNAGSAYNFDLNQIIALASIIEGEAILDDEKPVISSVYHNRLRLGMLLQADPTIQYIIDDGPRRLLNRDLQIESPYNTYKYAGLPPGPINNPGLAAIKAAVFPVESKFLYFVADGKGGHVFSETLAQHNRAKQQFNQIRRQVAREKRRKEM